MALPTLAKLTSMSGLYRIRNRETGRVYYGSARNLRERWGKHCSDLKYGRHSNRQLQADWNARGASAFSFEALAVLEPADLRTTEARMLARVAGSDCYNVKFYATAAAEGSHWSPEARAALSAQFAGKPKPAEHRAKIAASLRGRTFSATHRAALTAARFGRGPVSEQSRARMSAAHALHDHSQMGFAGRQHSDETKARIATSSRAAWERRRVNGST